MRFSPQAIKGVYIIDFDLYTDERGAFTRTFCKKEFEQIGHEGELVQLNHSWNTHKGTIRGMHFQNPPYAETKLIRCVKGSVMDIVVDIRKNSETFLQHLSIELSETNNRMIYIPKGFAHGFQTLEDNSQLIYHHTEYYTPAADNGLNFNDPLLKIKWPLQVTVISEKDRNLKFIDNTFLGI